VYLLTCLGLVRANQRFSRPLRSLRWLEAAEARAVGVLDQTPALFSEPPKGGDEVDEKLETQAAQLAAIDQATLTPLAQSALNSETTELKDWECQQLHGGIGMGTAIYRFAGQGRDQGQKVPWSLILKTLCPAEDNANVSAWNYYKREADAYQSGWLDNLPSGLAAPRCFGVVEHRDGTCWIWLEAVAQLGLAAGLYCPVCSRNPPHS
jgi:hypothetical protein